MANKQEADHLWQQMQALERTRPGVQEDQQAFFANKAKEMRKLKEAYDKAVGLNSSDPRVQRAIGQKRIQRFVTGEKYEGPETSDSL